MALAIADHDAVVRRLADDPRLVHLEELPARPARFGELAVPLPAAVAERVAVQRLWSHQCQAIDLARAGTSVAVATGTASGKSLCYQLPVAEAVCAPVRPGTSLLVFPTKALAHDQLRALHQLDVPGLVAAAYDGDTDPAARTWARANANVVLTNPEMLHHGVLPHHERWATFLMRLRYVVIDELHVLRGVFGTHVAHLLRRLRRLCAQYGSDPTFVFSSATIGSPGRLASDLCGLPVAEVTDDGSPRGRRQFVLWNPAGGDDPGGDPSPALDGHGIGGRRPSANRQTAAIMAELICSGRRAIAFCASRKGTELVAADVRRRLPPELADRVRPYRGGYLADERRLIESELFGGQLRGVVATSALELGIDVGGLDACVLDGFPGTIASMWQQAGRAGRQSQDAVVVLVAGDDQLDQWLMSHPDQVFGRPPEPAVINPANPFVAHAHLACAAYERPLAHDDERWWPGVLDDAVRDLVVADQLKVRTRSVRGHAEPRAVWAARGWPSHDVGLRNGSTHEVQIARSDGTPVGTVDHGRAARLVHPGAVYLHQGQAFEVVSLDLDVGEALVEPCDGGEWTQPRSVTDVAVLASDQHRAVGRSRLDLGRVLVTSQVVGYRRFESSSGELLANEELHLPPSQLDTRAFWYTFDDQILAEAGLHASSLDASGLGGALHAAEHAAIGLLPLFTICDRWDVGGLSTPWLADTGRPTIVIYDGYPGGAGIAELGYGNADRHLQATLEVIEACGCDDGCPSCVQSPKCGNGNEPLDKAGAARLLAAVTRLDARG